MSWANIALGMAGIIGSGVAVVHGVLTQRLMVEPIVHPTVANQPISAPIRRLVPLLLHYSTVSWFFGGLALIAAATCLHGDARTTIGLFVGSLYLYGALGNFWGTRGRHPGWMLMAAALVLIAIGLGAAG